jgi:hypothetical protein
MGIACRVGPTSHVADYAEARPIIAGDGLSRELVDLISYLPFLGQPATFVISLFTFNFHCSDPFCKTTDFKFWAIF